MKKVLTIILLTVSMTVQAQVNCKLGESRLTDALGQTAWERSEWISVVDAPVITGRVDDPTCAADGASWFVTTIKNKKKVKRARWMTTGLGVYDIYVNGKTVGEEVLKPGFTHYAKTRRSFTYDITPLLNLKAGTTNQLAAEVTPGWWADKIITPGGHDGMIGRKCAFRCVLELTYTDGTTEFFGSNTEEWTAGIGGQIKHAAIFDGEEFDARELPGYENIGSFKKPEINNEFNGEILPTNGAEVYLRHDLTLSPIKAYVWQGVTGASDEAFGKAVIKKEFAVGETINIKVGETLVVDFGQNAAAVPQFVFEAKEGTRLTCLPGELLNDGNGAKSRGMDGPEGSVHRQNLRIHDNSIRLDYTFAASDMAQATGRNVEKYTKMAEEARTYVKERFLTADGCFKTDILNTMQTPALFALKNNIVSGEAQQDGEGLQTMRVLARNMAWMLKNLRGAELPEKEEIIRTNFIR